VNHHFVLKAQSVKNQHDQKGKDGKAFVMHNTVEST
jgi:hypothetical protein